MSNRYQKEPKIKLHTPFKKSLILGMKTDEKNYPNTTLLFSNKNHIQSSFVEKKSFVNFGKLYINIKHKHPSDVWKKNQIWKKNTPSDNLNKYSSQKVNWFLIHSTIQSRDTVNTIS